jgi:DNA-binding transcriptional ArsR family regulator
MVEQSIELDGIFGSLADATRRDMLKRVAKTELSISALAQSYKMSFAAIAKHVNVLETSRLVIKRKEGREQIISANPKTIQIAMTHLEQYEKLWGERFSELDQYFNK